MGGFKSFVNGCATKKPYPSLGAAERRAAEVLKENGTVLRPYRCEVCGSFHVTKKPATNTR